jgi:hypothetical protein
MKKHRLLIMSILLLLVSFVTAWYNDLIFHRLSFLVLPIYIILPVCFIALLVISIKRIGKRKEYVSFFSIAVLVLLVLLLVFFPFRDAKAKAELALYEADRLEIIEMIKTDRLQPKDTIGNVDLPAGYRRLSSDGEVFVYQNDVYGQVIGFGVFRGLSSGSVELIYSSGGEELIRANESGHPIRKIERLKENWYLVETDY